MAYSHFTLSDITKRFHITLTETTDLFEAIPEAPIRPEFWAQFNTTLPLALSTSTEKARSEFIIAPVLVELWLLQDRQIGLLSGVEFNIDEAQGLVGVCDYILTRSPEQMFVRAPVMMLVEAKNEDLKRGYGQCIAEMIAAQRFNAREGSETPQVYGVVTIGELWRFLILEGDIAHIDSRSYHIDRLPKIMGILLHLTRKEDNNDAQR